MGPLNGLKIIEISGVGPAPFACMMLADMGAEVIRVERPGGGVYQPRPELDFINRGKRCIAVDLKKKEGLEVIQHLANTADGFIEGFRPGVAERLGIGPDDIMPLNRKMVYGRMTGWGRKGPMANAAGHDINYISLTGTLYHIGEKDRKPAIPLNLLGDFGGGGMLLAFGMVTALFEAERSGTGQVVDASMIDGVAAMMASMYTIEQTGYWDERGCNILDSGAHFYNVYACKDGKYISIGAIEPQFYQNLLNGLGLSADELPQQHDKSTWPDMKARFEQLFAEKTRAEWLDRFEGIDACLTPVLSMGEALQDKHLQENGTIINPNGIYQGHPAPRFSKTPAEYTFPAGRIGEDSKAILEESGLDSEKYLACGAVVQAG